MTEKTKDTKSTTESEKRGSPPAELTANKMEPWAVPEEIKQDFGLSLNMRELDTEATTTE